ncbi:hypothetical protein ACFQZC_10785 [Streptacidiphilus monticola]
MRSRSCASSRTAASTLVFPRPAAPVTTSSRSPTDAAREPRASRSSAARALRSSASRSSRLLRIMRRA